MQLTIVTLAALLTAVATGLGALPLLAFKNGARSWLGPANAVAAGAMLAASSGLVYEGAQEGLLLTGAGLATGALFMALSGRLFAARGLGGVQGADAVRMVTIVVVMTVHSVSEGIGIGVAYGDGAALGILITVALALHNVPEGLAISLVLVPRGVSVRRAAGWSVFSSLPQPLMAIPAFLFVESFRDALPVGLGFAAGAMTWMVARDLIPEAREEASWSRTATWFVAAFLTMVALQAAFLS